MLRRSGFSAAVLLIGGLLTATPAALAKPIDHSPPSRSAIHEVFGSVWAALARLFVPPTPLGHAATAACGERGSIMDPDGCPGAQVPGSSSDAGSIMDPDG